MKTGLLILFTCISNYFFGATWIDIFDTYRNVLASESILPNQQRAFASAQAPTIVDSRIKEIPISENGEELIDLRLMTCQRIFMMDDPSIPFEGPTFHSGLPQASKMRMGVFKKLLAMIVELDRLAHYFGYEPGQIDIKVFEGLRDLKTQKKLFEKKVEEILQITPHLSLEMAEREASKWVSPYKNNVPVHSTGAAVDIRLWDNRTSGFLDMGAFGVIWGKNENAPTFSENLIDRQKQNRFYCFVSAERAGLTNYAYEYWHFSSGDRYDAYWKKNDPSERKAFYGPAQ